MNSTGLDLSICETGISVLSETGNVLFADTIKSKPAGKKPKQELKRLQKIVKQIEQIIDKYNPEIALIENLAFGVRKTTSLTQLAGLSYLVRDMLDKKDITFLLCTPTTLKKFATGSGKAEKLDMVDTAIKKFKTKKALNDNVADSLFLAEVGIEILKPKTKKQHQKDTIKLLKKQI